MSERHDFQDISGKEIIRWLPEFAVSEVDNPCYLISLIYPPDIQIPVLFFLKS